MRIITLRKDLTTLKLKMGVLLIFNCLIISAQAQDIINNTTIIQTKAENTQSQLQAKIQQAEKDENWKLYARLSIVFVDKYLKNNHLESFNYAYKFYLNDAITNKRAHKKALKWVKTAIEKDKIGDYYNLAYVLFYPDILYKFGRKKAALVAAQEAIKELEFYGKDTAQISELIDKIKFN